MRFLISIIFFSLFALALRAQQSSKFLSTQKHYLYSSGEYVVGKEQAGSLALNYNYKDKYTVNIGYWATFKSPVSPANNLLKSGSNITHYSATQPFENTESLHMLVGTIVNINRKKNLRLLLQAGPGISTYREPEFSLLATANQYSFRTTASKKLSFVLNPKIEMPLFSTVGCSIGPMVIINSNQRFIGAGIGLMYGLIKQDKL